MRGRARQGGAQLGSGLEAESLLKLSDNIRDGLREIVERGNARFAPKRAVTRKDYLTGKAHISWGVSLVASGRRYELSFLVKAVEGAGDIDAWPPIPEAGGDSDLHRTGDGNDQAVFIYEVQIMDCAQGRVPSWVRVQVSHDLHSDWTGFPDILFQPFFQIVSGPGKREMSVFDCLSLRARNGRDEVIQSGSQIVDGVANNERELSRSGSPLRDVVAVSLCFEIRLLPDSVWVAAKEMGGLAFQVRDVAIRPLDL